MIKKLSLLMLAVLFVGGCGHGNMTAWMLSGTSVDIDDEDNISDDNIYAARVGYEIENIEGGLELSYVGVEGERQNYGFYLIGYLPMDPNGLTPYGGYRTTLGFDADKDGAVYGPLAGILYPKFLFDADWAVEGWYQDASGPMKDSVDDWRAVVGPRWKF